MASSFLETVDMLLGTGITSLSQTFIETQTAYISSKQLPDGGFPGRLGGSDLYYTDFAARTLALLSPTNSAFQGISEYINQRSQNPHDVIECFSILNIARILRSQDIDVYLDTTALVATLHLQQLPQGGFARHGNQEISAYNTFLAALCFDMLEIEIQSIDATISCIQNLQQSDGGFSEGPGQLSSQTNATAAVVAVLRMFESINQKSIDSSSAFLASMQDTDGGLRAQPNAPESDLLATFTGLLTLAMLDDPGRLNIPVMARFIRALTIPNGGFGACVGDDESDIEYTYYGIGTISLLRAYADSLG